MINDLIRQRPRDPSQGQERPGAPVPPREHTMSTHQRETITNEISDGEKLQVGGQMSGRVVSRVRSGPIFG